ncbi:helix-turn-helix domain-containing protein [Cohnella abietis]|uniref:AraC family transcriptional regulator n=1 Tax=Cohnella abietis TaxID=2507935 RepID=A0A3T1D616_9BACL|nr:helix-turn-helix domain-containing protein [Cohnella abietis]BBI33445.1 hypothetical protein KCTCHS21_28440 [Cohnella abietis]
MTKLKTNGLPFRSIFFALDKIQSKTHKSREHLLEQASSIYTILAVTAGQGFFNIAGIDFRVARGQCYLLPPEVKMEVTNDGEEDLNYYRLSFEIISKEQLGQDSQFLEQGELKVEPFDRYADIFKKICDNQRHKSDKEQFRNQYRFQKLMYWIIEQNLPFDQPKDSRKTVEETLSYLQEHYHEDVTTEQLAAQAHLGTKQYAHLFKKMTGKTPIDYVTEMRIRKAKELLIISSGHQLRDIAEQVGYSDPYYFNRRFKQVVGIPPRQFIRKRQFRIISTEYACSMLALGLKPIGAPAYQLGFYAKNHSGGIDNIGDKGTFYFDKMKSLKPDLFVLGDEIEPEVSAQLLRIAPVVHIPWMGLDATGHLRAVADLLGMTKEAEAWIQMYETKRDETKFQLKSFINIHETVGILVVEGQDLYVLGDRNAGEIVYRTLGMTPPQMVRRQLEAHPNQYGRKVSLDKLPDYEADRLLIIVYGNEAQTTFNGIQHDEIWRNLRAVRNNNVQVIDAEKWIYYDVLSLQGQLDEAVSLFSNNGR